MLTDQPFELYEAGHHDADESDFQSKLEAFLRKKVRNIHAIETKKQNV